ncbi:heterokaryon incompatibility protein-domain-containing protein [Xylariaceae sp. AK1471]|nr:heterokaryon incompatibility protein-domain-containing protein [Xylariaceae sp. AK1471]
MAPVHFQAHSCRHCNRLVIDLATKDEILQESRDWNMSQDKVVFDFTFRDLLSAAADGCGLCSWILNGEAISRQLLQESPYIVEDSHMIDHSTYELLARVDDENLDYRQPSLLEAVRSRDILCIRYFGLWDPRTKLIPYRTASSLQSFTCEQDTAAVYLSTRPIENKPSERFNEISFWLENCKRRHPRCRTIITSLQTHATGVKPKRLIRIEKLNTEALEELPPFAALSYCWGGDQTVRCDESTTKGFETHIPIEILPATIQDAITVCEQLGIHYLWVDALCILQDSHADKTIEIAKMPYIYGGAVFTIVASRARSAWDGFLKTRIPTPENVSAFQLPWRCLDGQIGTVTIVELDTQPEPIDDRGWTFQERFLSTRHLSEPNSAVGYVDGWRKEGESFMSHGDEKIWETVKDDPYHGWEYIVLKYSERKLTHATDRPLAISGMAERYGQLVGDEYFAGLWKRYLKSGLLWAVLARDRGRRPPSYQGPSWSWLAVSGPVFNLQLNRGEWGPERFDAEISSIQTELVSARAPFGAIIEGSGRLSVKGRLARATYRREDPPGVDSSSDHDIKIMGATRTATAGLYLDYIEDAVDSPHSRNEDREVMVLEIESRAVGPSWFSFGIVLCPFCATDGEIASQHSNKDGLGTFMRIGVFELATSLDEFRSRSATDAAGWGERTEQELNCFKNIEPCVIEIV